MKKHGPSVCHLHDTIFVPLLACFFQPRCPKDRAGRGRRRCSAARRCSLCPRSGTRPTGAWKLLSQRRQRQKPVSSNFDYHMLNQNSTLDVRDRFQAFNSKRTKIQPHITWMFLIIDNKLISDNYGCMAFGSFN